MMPCRGLADYLELLFNCGTVFNNEAFVIFGFPAFDGNHGIRVGGWNPGLAPDVFFRALEVGLREVGFVIRMGVVKANHCVAIAGCQFFDFLAEGGVDLVAIVALAGLGIMGWVQAEHLTIGAISDAHQNAAAFGGEGLFAVGVDLIEVLLGHLQHG